MISSVSEPASRVPTRLSSVIFRGKAAALQLRRAARDSKQRIRRHELQREMLPHILAESRSPLWSEASPAERALQAGKVQNLRAALRNLDTAGVAPHEIFSFWKQIGRATRGRGFTSGRLLREGCLMPAVGGGLCQLSNALYDVALNGGLEIVERWAHSRVIPGSAAAVGRDATVAWNYIDLRFRANFAWQIEARLSSDELIVRLRTAVPRKAAPTIPLDALLAPRPLLDEKEHSCVSCGAHDCFRSSSVNVKSTPEFRRTFIVVNERWPEFENYIASQKSRTDGFLLPFANSKQARYAWNTENFASVHDAKWHAVRRSLESRKLGALGAQRLQAQLRHDESLARALAKHISPAALHVVVAQSFLPFLWRDGILGGRTFDVLMTRLPLRFLHEKLDSAFGQFPERATLGEYRAPHELVENESAALGAAAKIITPHSAVAALFPKNAVHLDWSFPTSQVAAQTAAQKGEFSLIFPGPTAARKGAYEVREAARALGLEVILCGSELEGENFWNGVKTRRATSEDWRQSGNIVIQPALVEDNPRASIAALAAGLRVIATPNCGLNAHPNLFLVPENDAVALVETVKRLRVSLR